VEEFDPDEVFGWINNILVFKNEPLDEVMARLERAYGIRFILPDSAAGRIKITANFRNVSFKIVSEALRKTTGFTFTQTGGTGGVKSILFSRKPQDTFK